MSGGSSDAKSNDCAARLADAGARVSIDLNYRKKLWSEKEAQAAMRPLVTGVVRPEGPSLDMSINSILSCG